jgi:hypothetical protein
VSRLLFAPVATIALLAGCGGAGGPPAFRTVTSEQQGLLLSAFVASDGTAYLAGGVTGGGAGSALLLRWDGQTVTSIPTGDAQAFWWIHGVSDGEMWLAGEGGEVYRFDGTTLARVDAGAPSGAILFGIWGASGDDLWTVGGSFAPGGPRQVIQHLSGGSWAAVPSPAEVSPDVTYFKVWGASAAEVWIVGDQGVVLRADAAGLARADAPGAERYVTVHGCGARDVYAVGGGGSAAAAHFDGAAWSAISSFGDAPPLSGVACTGGAAYVGGYYGYAAHLVASGNPSPIAMPPDLADLVIHGVATGPGRVLGVGGDLAAVAPNSQRGFAVELEH